MPSCVENFNILTEVNGRSLCIVSDNQLENPEWDDFVLSLPAGHHEQTSLWGQIRVRYGWKTSRLLCVDQGTIIAGTQIMVRPLRSLCNLAYVTYGPCFKPDSSIAPLFLSQLKSYLTKLKVSYVVVGLPYAAHDLISPLQACGFVQKPTLMPPHFLEATLVIDLANDKEQILNGMRSSTRRNVRHAFKKGITVVEGGEQDIETFRSLMLSLCRRRSIPPNPSQPDFFNYLWKNFYPKGWVKLFIAKHNQEPVSAALAFSFGKWFRVWKVGWSGDHGNLKPNEAMWWEMIQFAQRTGHRYFDFVDIDSVLAKAILAGDMTEPPSENVASFKLGFGGSIQLLPGAFCYSPNPILNTALRLGLLNIFKFPLLSKILNKTIST